MNDMARLLIGVFHPPAAEGKIVQMIWRPTESINLKPLGPVELLSRIYTKGGGCFPVRKVEFRRSLCA